MTAGVEGGGAEGRGRKKNDDCIVPELAIELNIHHTMD